MKTILPDEKSIVLNDFFSFATFISLHLHHDLIDPSFMVIFITKTFMYITAK